MKTIFVSSTFKDMQLERDVIQNKITPKLNIIAREYGDEISFCDLRWGVDTSELESEEGSKKVLEVCLDEIDRCQPPMIVILGDRYGWIPSDTLIEDTSKRKKLELDHLKKSVTALEIEYGALHNENTANNTFFYYREIENEFPSDFLSEDEEHKQLLEQLKEKIRKICGNNIKTYKVRYNENNSYALDTFETMLYEDLKQYFMKQWSTFEKKSPFEKESYKHEMYAQAKNNMFRTRNKLVQICLDSIDKNTYTFIKGEVGSGKSTLVSHLYEHIKKDCTNVFIRFCALTDKSDTALEIFEQLMYYVENKLEIGHKKFNDDSTIQDKKKYFEQICSEYDSFGEKCYLIIDAVDQLKEDTYKEYLSFIPTKEFKNLRFVVSAIETFSLGMRNYIKIENLKEFEKKEIIKGILHTYDKEISNTVIEAIVQNEMSKNPLYISFIIQRLTMMNKDDFNRIHALGDGIEAIIKHQLDILKICPTTLEEMSIEVLKVAGERINKNLIEKITKYISISRYGLRVRDLHGVLKDSFNTLDFSHFVSLMQNNFVIRENGCYDFSHKSIREGYLKQISEEEKKELHQQLADYFLTIEKEDPIRTNEVVYHLLMAEDIKNYVKYIEDFAFDKKYRYINKCAMCTHYISLSKEKTWLANIIAKSSNYVTNRAIVTFTNLDIFDVLNFTVEEKEMYVLALQEALKIIKKIYPGTEPIQNKYMHVLTLYRLGQYSLENRFEYFDQALTYINEVLKEDIRVAYRKRKSDILYYLAITCEDKFKVNGYYKEAIKILEEILQEKETISTYKELVKVYESYIFFNNQPLNIIDEKYTQEELNKIRKKVSEYYEKIIELSKNTNPGTYYLSILKQKVGMKEKETTVLENKIIYHYEKLIEQYPTKVNYNAYAQALEDMARLSIEKGYDFIAIKYYDMSSEIHQRVIDKYNEYDNKVSIYWHTVKKGNIYRLSKIDYTEQAIECYKKAIEMKYIPEDIKTGTYNFLGDIYRSRGMHEEAMQCYLKADKIDEETKSSKGLSKPYAEVREILKSLGPTYINKLPKWVVETIETSYSRLYKVPFKGKEWTKKTNELLEKTQVIITIFNIQYWTTEENRKEYVKQYKENLGKE